VKYLLFVIDIFSKYLWVEPLKRKVAKKVAKGFQHIFDKGRNVRNNVFAQGIPEQLNDESFVDPRYPSLIVIDDLMRDATNNKDVCELLVEGSHLETAA
jgi:hypothetical protein